MIRHRFVLNLILVAVLILAVLPALVVVPIATSKWIAEAAPTIETFNSTPGGGTWNVPAGVTSVEVLVVGGGGAGGGRHGGGGGAGGLVYHATYAVTPGDNITVTVGAGGLPQQVDSVTQTIGGNGGNSVFGTITALGGGGGGSYTAAVPTGGGSGGGGGGGSTFPTHGLKNQGDSGGGTGYGFNGGDGNSTGTNTGAGGGGGAGAVGSNAAGADSGGNGGTGRAYSISGSSVTYAGGGGGGGNTSGGTGGSGGGGNGGQNTGTAGTANTGGGGGGIRSLTTSAQGKAGGSGVVIISYTPGVIITTQAVTNITSTTLTGNGNITSVGGGGNATRRGFCYKVGLSGDPTTADSVAYDDGSFGTGAYTKAITGLTEGTNYRVRAYAVNPVGTFYGTTVQGGTIATVIDYMEYSTNALARATYVDSVKTLYSGEIISVAGNPAVASVVFANTSFTGLTKANGMLKIDLKCDNPSLMSTNAQLELTSSGGSDHYEWALSDLTGLGITSSYQTFYIPLSNWATTPPGEELNVSAINWIRWYQFTTSGTVTISFRNAYIVPASASSESTIKTQGTYSLKVNAAATISSGATLVRTISSPLNLAGTNTLLFDIYSSRTGSNIKIGIVHSKDGTGGTITHADGYTYHTVNGTSANFVPAVTGTVSVQCWGAGGGGGFRDYYGGGGGGGGAYAATPNVAVTASSTYAMVGGAGGARDTAAVAASSTFATTTVIAFGGTGVSSDSGGAGGVGSSGTGTTKYSGGAGNNAHTTVDAGGGGGGSGGPDGTGVAGAAATASAGGAGGRGNNNLGGPGGIVPGGTGTSYYLGGGGGAGNSVDAGAGGIGGTPGGGGAGTDNSGAGATGGPGQVTVSYLTNVAAETTPNITSAGVWQTVIWDISAVADADKDAIDYIVITISNATADNTFYIDNFYALNVPTAPTSVAATDGTYTNTVTITWAKSSGATGYYVFESTNLLATLGDVATYNDNAAGAPTITAGTASATDGDYTAYVTLSVTGESGNNGASRTYKVRAFNAAGNGSDSSTDTGYRGTTTLTYQWQISAADSDASYSNSGTTDPYDDTGAPANGGGRYFKCTISMTDATPQTTAADRGYRRVSIDIAAPNISSWDLNIGNNSINGTLTVNVSSPSVNWYVTANDSNSSTAGRMTLWNGSSYNTSVKLETAMNVSGNFGEVTLPIGGNISKGTGNSSHTITFKQVLTWNDSPGTYQIVVTFIATLE